MRKADNPEVKMSQVYFVLGMFDATAGTLILLAHKGYMWLIILAYTAALFRFNQWRRTDD